MKMQSRDVVGGNVEKIAALFPHCVTERLGKDGKTPELAIDFDKLRAELTNEVLDDREERYQFTWPDKRAASRLANEPTPQTLRPCREESVDFDNTENLYIEGDNLDVLKVLRETYLGKVKMIYIDPPYNTGNDFVYNDDFAQGKGEFEQNSGLYDEEGNQTLDPMQRNTEANGRFHTDWLNMIYPRLKVAKDLLSDNGVIFISIDDNEQRNLRNICDEVFGESNFVATIVWQKKYAATNDSKGFSTTHDYIVVYQKSNLFTRNLLPRTKEQNIPYKYDDNDGKGLWRSDNILVKSFSKLGVYPITNPNTGVDYYPPKGSCWRASQETMKKWLSENRIYFGKDGKGAPQLKRYLSEVQQGRVPITWWTFDEVGHNDEANKEMSALFEAKTPFDTSKPSRLLKQIIQIGSNDDSIIIDFFSGSATTAHAVMQLNAEDGGHRKFIMVQFPELIEKTREAYKAGYKNICDIGKERIRRARVKIKKEIEAAISSKKLTIQRILLATPSSTARLLLKEQLQEIAQEIYNRDVVPLEKEIKSLEQKLKKLDTGFRVLKLDSSNMEDVYYTPDQFETSLFESLEDNIKPDRTSEDLLFQVMLDLGIELSAKIESKQIAGKEVFSVDDDYLLACFDTNVNETTIEEMAKLLPTHLVIRDASVANDNVLDNFDQIIESYSNEKKITTHVL